MNKINSLENKSTAELIFNQKCKQIGNSQYLMNHSMLILRETLGNGLTIYNRSFISDNILIKSKSVEIIKEENGSITLNQE